MNRANDGQSEQRTLFCGVSLRASADKRAIPVAKEQLCIDGINGIVHPVRNQNLIT